MKRCEVLCICAESSTLGRLSLFFFFQAEDGIRDYKVTGVQTCALPIYREIGQLDSPLTPRGLKQAQALAHRLSGITFDALYSSDLGRAVQTAQIIARSEERRVGKECRSRWSPYH